jgi:YVTN family beta-propeller protein
MSVGYTHRYSWMLGLWHGRFSAWRWRSTIIAVFLSVVCAVAIVVIAPAIADASPTSFAYVTDDNGLSVVNTSTNTVVATVADARGVAVAVASDGAYAYVAGDGFSVVDTATDAVVATVALPEGSDPTALAITPNGQFAYITNYDGTVTVINIPAGLVVANIALPAGSEPNGVAITPAGTFAYVSNFGGYGSPGVSVISTATDTVVDTVNIPAVSIGEPFGFPAFAAVQPSGIAVAPSGAFAYVTTNDYEALVVATSTNTIVADVPMCYGGIPYGMSFAPTGAAAYVACSYYTITAGSVVEEKGNLSVINTSTNTVTASALVGDGPNPDVAVTPDGRFAYVTNGGDGTVSVLNTSNNTVTATVPVGDDPAGIAIGPAITPPPDILAMPAARTRSTSATFEFSSDTEGAQLECSLDGAAFSACTSPQSYSGLADGEHAFQVRELDSGAEASAPSQYHWSVDTHPPTVAIDSAPSGAGNESAATITFHGSAEDGNDSAIAFTCSLDGAAPVSCAAPDVLTGLADGTHTISISAEDDLGNNSAAPAIATWTVGGSDSGAGSLPPESTCESPALASVSRGSLVMDARDGACIVSAKVAGVAVWKVGGPVTLDGITVTPDPGVKLTLTKSAQGATFSSTGGVSFQLGKLEPVHDSAGITWTLSGGLLRTGSNVPFVKSIGGLAANLDLSALELSSAEGGSVKLTFRPTLPKVFSSLPGSANAVAGQFAVTASNANGLDFSAQLSVGQLYLGPIELRKLRLGFDADSLTFDGSVTIALAGQGGPSIATSITIGPESAESVFGCCIRQFAVTAQDLNEPIPGTPLFLQSIGGSAHSGKNPSGTFYPIIVGDAAVSIGPKVRRSPAAVQLAGSLTLALSEPWTLSVEGNATVASLPLIDGKATYTSEPPGVQLQGKIQATIRGYGLSAEITPKTFFQGTESFNVDAIGTVTLGELAAQGEVVFSNNGFAACATINNPFASYSLGWGELADGTQTVFAGTCDMGPYSATMSSARARAAGTPFTLSLGAHHGPRLLAVHGAGAAPALTLAGPSGLSLDGVAGVSQTPMGLVIPDPSRDTTFVILNRSPAGTYTLTSTRTRCRRSPSGCIRAHCRVDGAGSPTPSAPPWARSSNSTNRAPTAVAGCFRAPRALAASSPTPQGSASARREPSLP